MTATIAVAATLDRARAIDIDRSSGSLIELGRDDTSSFPHAPARRRGRTASGGEEVEAEDDAAGEKRAADRHNDLAHKVHGAGLLMSERVATAGVSRPRLTNGTVA